MATLSSHLLNSINGTHASNVEIIIYQTKSNGEKKVFCETKTDSGGRLLKEFTLNDEDCKSEYEMICKTGNYFSETVTYIRYYLQSMYIKKIFIRFSH